VAPHPRSVLERLRSTYWFLPSVLTALAVGLSFLFTAFDRSAPDSTAWLAWGYGGGANGARALLSAVAGSMITVVSVTFSVLVVALTVSSQHFGPQLLRSFMRDQPAQIVLGTFTGTFVYCLMVLRTVQGGDGEAYDQFVPQLAVTGAIVLALVSVAALIYYVHHVAVSMQVSEITRRVAADLEGAIERLYPDPIGHGSTPPIRTPPPVPHPATTARARGSGYVQEIDAAEVLALAERHETVIWLTARPGDFVIEGEAVATMSPEPANGQECSDALARAIVVGSDRTSQQDSAFAIQQLVEVALRALSPAMNEPFTAMTTIDRLGQALRALAGREIPAAARSDRSGTVRVIAEPRTFTTLVAAAFEPIALYSGGNPDVIRRLFETYERLGRAARRSDDRAALARLVALTWAGVQRDVKDAQQRAALAAVHDRAHRAVGTPEGSLRHAGASQA
jgi:uncharacterized membrane protein